MSERTVKIYTRERQLVVTENRSCFHDITIAIYPVATAKYSKLPKYWCTDYRNPSGSYKIKEIHQDGSNKLDTANAFHVPWYLSSKYRDRQEDAGTGLYGVGMIILDYPNTEDQSRYMAAQKSGMLKKIWFEFCKSHLEPIYQRYAQQEQIGFDEVKMDGDYGPMTYNELIKEFPINDPEIAFRLGVGIHGTNDPECIGTDKTAGCFRMHNEDILSLMSLVEIGTPVEINPFSFVSM